MYCHGNLRFKSLTCFVGLSSRKSLFRATLNKKVRNAQLAQYNFIFVVGEKEMNSGKFIVPHVKFYWKFPEIGI